MHVCLECILTYDLHLKLDSKYLLVLLCVQELYLTEEGPSGPKHCKHVEV